MEAPLYLQRRPDSGSSSSSGITQASGSFFLRDTGSVSAAIFGLRKTQNETDAGHVSSEQYSATLDTNEVPPVRHRLLQLGL